MSSNFLGLLIIAAALSAGMLVGYVKTDIAVFVFVMVGWVLTVCAHEFGHAYAAYHGGDRSVRDKGYLSLDPLRYADPLGSVILPLVFVAMGGIGLPGAAVYIQPAALRSAAWRSLTSLAGPLASLAALVALSAPFALGLDGSGAAASGAPFWAGLAFLAFLQATAVILNLLPIPGFDGYGVIEPFLPPKVAEQLAPLKPMLIIAALVVLFTIPEAGRALFGAAGQLAGWAGLDIGWVAVGVQRFRFWS